MINNKIKIAIIGLGQIGLYLYNELRLKKKEIEIKTGQKINIVAISAKNKTKKRHFKIDKKIFYSNPLKIFNAAISNVKPNLECRSRRVGGATYQVPVEVKSKRAQALALRWLMDATRKRKNKTMADKLYAEILDASQNKGSAIKKREDTHKMAEANKAFAHFRW